MRGILSEVGWIQRVIVNRVTGHVVDGHLRIEEAISRGEATVPVTYVSLSEAEERLVLASFDPIGAMATADAERLEELLRDLNTGDAGLDALLDSLRVPDFLPVSMDEQGRLDQRASVTCPECGHVFTP